MIALQSTLTAAELADLRREIEETKLRLVVALAHVLTQVNLSAMLARMLEPHPLSE